LKKIQDGIRFKVSLQKSIERKILIQKSLFCSVVGFRLVRKNLNARITQFPNLQFVKNTTFSKFSQNLSFYFRAQRKSCYKLHKESQTKLAAIGEPMVPNRYMAGCFRKYLPLGNTP
jgi:hypothetical protein